MDKQSQDELEKKKDSKPNQDEFLAGMFIWIIATLLIRILLIFFLDAGSTENNKVLFELFVYIVISVIAVYIFRKKGNTQKGNGIILYTILIILGSTIFRLGCSPIFVPFPISICLAC